MITLLKIIFEPLVAQTVAELSRGSNPAKPLATAGLCSNVAETLAFYHVSMVECAQESLLGLLPQRVGSVVGFASVKLSFDDDCKIVTHFADVWHIRTSFLRVWYTRCSWRTPRSGKPEESIQLDGRVLFSNCPVVNADGQPQ